MLRITEIIKGNNLEEKVPFTFDYFCSMSIIENTLSLRVIETILKSSL